jgi:hypothetical protein
VELTAYIPETLDQRLLDVHVDVFQLRAKLELGLRLPLEKGSISPWISHKPSAI